MTLLICVFAAIIATVKWYQRKDDSLMLGVPCVLFWGASLMWLGDAKSISPPLPRTCSTMRSSACPWSRSV